MTPTEKHRETAKDIAFDFDCDWTADGRRRGEAEYRAAIEAIAAALSAAEREGMMRADAICYARSKAHHKQSKTYEAEGDELSQTQCLADAVEAMNCAAAIRAQAGEA